MIFINKILVVTASSLFLWGCQQYKTRTSEALDDFNVVSANLVTGGQPSQEDLITLKNAGVREIIDLRGPGESAGFDEAQKAKALGMEYTSLPIAGAADVTSENAAKLHELLAESDGKVYLHCASGNRAGALLAIRAHEVEGKPVEAALDAGRKAGMTSLEEKTRSVLEGAKTEGQ